MTLTLHLSTSKYHQFNSVPNAQLHSNYNFGEIVTRGLAYPHARRTRKQNASSTVLTVAEA